MGWTGGLIQGGEDAPLAPLPRGGGVVFVVIIVLGWGVEGGSGSTAVRRCQGQAAHGAGSACRDKDEEDNKRAMAETGNGGQSRGSARADNN